MAKRNRKRGELRVERATYPNGNGGRAKTAKFYGWYRDLRGRRSRIALTDDRANSLRALQVLVDALKTASSGGVVQSGEIPPVVRRRFYEDLKRVSHKAASVANPITMWAEYMGEFEATLRSERNAPLYIANLTRYVREVGEACGFSTVQDFDDADAIKKHLARRIDAGDSLKVANHRIQAVKRFALWLFTVAKVLPDYPLRSLTPFNQDEDRRLERRALTADEVVRLIRTTAGGPIRGRFSGFERSLIYQLALEVGFRRNEIRTLRWKCFDMSDDQASVRIEAKNAKDRDGDILPLRSGLCGKLRVWRQSRGGGPDDHAFTQAASWRDTHIIIARDLEDAGIPIGRRVVEGGIERKLDWVDFHSLRTSFVTGLARGGVHPAKAQRLARHSDVNLTLRYYTKLTTTEQASAVAVLPDPDVPTAPFEQTEATG